MVILRLWTTFVFLCLIIYRTDGATHWIVTEKGMIQSHEGSPLDLRRPYDLISLLDQEKHWSEIQSVLQDIMSRKSAIESQWSTFYGDSGIASRLAHKPYDCLLNSDLGSMPETYSIATNGSDRIKVKLKMELEPVSVYKVPDCGKIEFSTPDYEHFPSLHSEEDVSLAPEGALHKLLPVASVQLFGHEIQKELVKNSSSWMHYNLAALFWRMKGNGSKAVACIRRALHHVPSLYRDIPLHNLAGILHQADRSKEAVLLLRKAIEHAPKQALHYLALGTIYFSMSDYNNSLLFYDKFLELEPEHGEVNAIKQITFCISQLETHLIDMQENVLGYLDGILTNLHDFHSLQQQWLRLSKRLMWEHSSYDEELGNFQEEAFELMFGKKGQRCVKKSSTISCDLVDSPIADFDTMNLQNLFQYVETETQKINERMAKATRLHGLDYKSEVNEAVPLSYPKFPTTMSTSGEKYFDVVGWPQKEECEKWNLPISESEDLKFPTFLPPENKGYDIQKILTDSIGLPNGSEHKLPWYPPVCDDSNALGEKYVQQSERHVLNNEIKSNHFLRNHFIKYVNNGKADEAEIGQRIITATEKKNAPNWVLSTLASLYWRIRGNTRKALDCLDLALKSAPKDQTDVALISIGSIVHQLGLTNQALKYANLAFKLNYVEPSTNFLLALLHYDSNPLMAMYYMKNVLRVDSEYYDGQAEFLLKLWGCRIKLGTYVKKPVDKVPQEICSEKESFKGQGMICSANGDDCKTASIQCFHTKSIEDGVVVKRPFAKLKSGVKHAMMGDGSGDNEPDQSQLERIVDSQHPFHMKILLGEDHMTSGPTPEFYVGVTDDSTSDTVLHVYDKSGTYPLSSQSCKEIVEADWVHFTSMWQSIAARNIDISIYLKALPKNWKKRSIKPTCTKVASVDSHLNHLTSKILHAKLEASPDHSLAEWLGIMSGDHKASVEELGAKIGLALQDNTTSWLLATAAALYWRVLGNAGEAVVCLRLALNHVPDDMKDVALISLANVLQRFGFSTDALEVAYLALKSNPNFVVNHFTVGNILTSMGDLEEAISFHRSALALDSNFEPARNRLQAILCTLLYNDSGNLRNLPEN